jgi:hypothetical protein
MSSDQFKKHLALFEGFWHSEEVAQQILDSLTDDDHNLTSDEVYRLIDEFLEMGDNPEEADRDEIAQAIFDKMGIEDEVDYGDNLHDRENEDYEEFVEPGGSDSSWNFESVSLDSIVGELLNEAPKRRKPAPIVEPADEEDDFSAPNRPLDVGDDEDFEDNVDDLDLDNLGIYVELDDY